MSNKKVFTEEEIKDICNKYKNNISKNKISNEYNISENVIKRVLIQNGIKLRQRVSLTDEQRKEKVKQRNKDWLEKNADYHKEYKKLYYEENKNKPDKYDKWTKNYKENNTKSILERKIRFYNDNKDKINEKRRKKNKEIDEKIKIKERNRIYTQENKIKIKERKRKYKKNKIINDKKYKLQLNISSLIRISLKRYNYVKKSKSEDILGCSIDFFKLYIESKFEPWMNWNNHGKMTEHFNKTWQLDHIIPVSSAKTEDEIVKLNHYTNFQPLCARVNNLIKGSKTY